MSVDRVQIQPRVNGKPFRCDCGCNVFTQIGDVMRCNACGAHFEMVMRGKGHVAPAEPVTLTAEEQKEFEYLFMIESGGTAAILDWLTQHGFALVRTGGADGN